MTYRKRKSQKTGANTRRTTTQSSKGTRITNSTTSSLGGKNKRTYSWSWSKGGRLKQTFTDNVNGYVKRRSRTLGSKNKKAPSTRRSTRQKSSGDGMGSIYWLVMLILAILFVTFPMSGLAIAATVGIIVVSWILLPYLVWILIFFVIFWLFF